MASTPKPLSSAAAQCTSAHLSSRAELAPWPSHSLASSRLHVCQHRACRAVITLLSRSTCAHGQVGGAMASACSTGWRWSTVPFGREYGRAAHNYDFDVGGAREARSVGRVWTSSRAQGTWARLLPRPRRTKRPIANGRWAETTRQAACRCRARMGLAGVGMQHFSHRCPRGWTGLAWRARWPSTGARQGPWWSREAHETPLAAVIIIIITLCLAIIAHQHPQAQQSIHTCVPACVRCFVLCATPPVPGQPAPRHPRLRSLADPRTTGNLSCACACACVCPLSAHPPPPPPPPSPVLSLSPPPACLSCMPCRPSRRTKTPGASPVWVRVSPGGEGAGAGAREEESETRVEGRMPHV